MPRETRWAKDGPSRRAPGMAMERTNPARSAGPYVGARPFGFFWGDCQKKLAQQGETRAIEQLDKRSRKRNFHSTHKLASPVAHVPLNAKIHFLRDAALLVVYLERPNLTPRAKIASVAATSETSPALRCRHVSSSSSSGPSPSMPSSLILRVRVLRPQPSSMAASRRRPAVCLRAISIMVRSKAGMASSSRLD